LLTVLAGKRIGNLHDFFKERLPEQLAQLAVEVQEELQRRKHIRTAQLRFEDILNGTTTLSREQIDHACLVSPALCHGIGLSNILSHCSKQLRAALDERESSPLIERQKKLLDQIIALHSRQLPREDEEQSIHAAGQGNSPVTTEPVGLLTEAQAIETKV
jgi:hypothetical protein